MFYRFINFLLLTIGFQTLFINSYITKVEKFEHATTKKSYYIFYDNHDLCTISENKDQCSKLLYILNKTANLNIVVESTAFDRLISSDMSSNYKALNRAVCNDITLEKYSNNGYYLSPYSNNKTYISWQLPLIFNFFKHFANNKEINFRNINLLGLDPRRVLDTIICSKKINGNLLIETCKQTLKKIDEILADTTFSTFIYNNFKKPLDELKNILNAVVSSSSNQMELIDLINNLKTNSLSYTFLFDLWLLRLAYNSLTQKSNNNDCAFITGAEHAQNLKSFLLANDCKLLSTETIEQIYERDQANQNFNLEVFWNNQNIKEVLELAQKLSLDKYSHESFKGLLHKASAFDKPQDIDKLLSFGAPINIDRDLNNNTALHAAAMLKNKNNFDYLVSQGIDTQAKNSKNLKACDYYDDSYLFKELLSIENFNNINALELYEAIFWKPDKVLSTDLKIMAKVLLKAIEKENHTITDMIMEFSDLTELRKHISDIKIIKFIDEIISLENLINNSINEIELKKQNNYLLLLVLKRLIHKGNFKGLVNIIKYDNIYTDLRELLADIYYNDNDRAIGEYYNDLYKNFIDQNYYDNWDIDFAEFQKEFVETIQFAKLCSNFLKNKEEYILSCLSNSEIISKNLKEKKLNSVNYRKLNKIEKECWSNIITTKKLYDKLQRAIESNRINEIRLILKKEPQIFNYIHPIDDITWTNIAREENVNIKIANLIVNGDYKNTNFSPGLASNSDPIYPLLISDDKTFIKFLLEKGAPVDQKQYEYSTPLADTLNILADNPDKKTKKRAFSKVKTLIKFGADLNSEDITDFEADINNEKITLIIQNIRKLEKNIKNIIKLESNYTKPEEASKLNSDKLISDINSILNKNHTNKYIYLKYLFYRAINTKNFLILVKLLDDQQIYNTLSYQLSKKRKNSNHLNLLREKKEKLELLNKKFPGKFDTNIKCKILDY